MPYIKDEAKAGAIQNPSTAGELNFAITHLIQTYLNQGNLNYQTINDIVGAVEGAKAEFQRRVVAPYEDIKIRENGDCYLPEFLSLPEPRTSSDSMRKYLNLVEDEVKDEDVDKELSRLLEEDDGIIVPHKYQEPKDDFDANCG